MLAVAHDARGDDRFRGLSPNVAWAGERSEEAGALPWLEDTRAPHQTMCAEYRNARNLRANPGMLEEYAASIETAAPSASGSAR